MIVYGRRRGGGTHDGTLCARYLHLLIFRIQYYSPPLAYPFVSEQQTLPAMVVDMMAAGGGSRVECMMIYGVVVTWGFASGDGCGGDVGKGDNYFSHC